MSTPSNTNASSSAFGWQFQTHAALVLMLRDIKDIDSIRVEGANDDIEIYYTDKHVDYAQAKARTTNEPGKGSPQRFKDALHTLVKDAQQKNCLNAIYVTNDEFPLGKSHNDIKFGYDSFLTFSELSPDQQKYITAKLHELLNGESDADSLIATLENHLAIYVMWFYGKDASTRTKATIRAIENFLAAIDPQSVSKYSVKLYSLWTDVLTSNAATLKTDVAVSKSELIWPLIVLLTEVNPSDKFFDTYDDEVVQDVIERYGQIIGETTERYDIISQVLSDFDQYKHDHHGISKQLREEFTAQNIDQYRSLIGADALDTDEANCVTALVVKKIIANQGVIAEIKEKVNLDN
jgi:hypothetical protein